MVRRIRDYALTKQSALGWFFRPKSFLKRLNEQLFSSTVWKLLRAFSIPSAALSSSPVATLRAAATDIARAFRFSICSWRFYIRTFLEKNPAETHPQNSSPQNSIRNFQCHFGIGFFWHGVSQFSKKIRRWIFEYRFLVRKFFPENRVRIHINGDVCEHFCKIFKRHYKLLRSFGSSKYRLGSNRGWCSIESLINGICINNINSVHLNFAWRFVNHLQNWIRVLIYNLKRIGIIIVVPFFRQICNSHVYIGIHQNPMTFVYEWNHYVNKKTMIARYKRPDRILISNAATINFHRLRSQRNVPVASRIIRQFFQIILKRIRQVFYRISSAGIVGIIRRIIDLEFQSWLNFFCKKISAVEFCGRFIMFYFSHPTRLIKSQCSKINGDICAVRWQFWRQPADIFGSNYLVISICKDWTFRTPNNIRHKQIQNAWDNKPKPKPPTFLLILNNLMCCGEYPRNQTT